MNRGISEDGLDLDSIRRDALDLDSIRRDVYRVNSLNSSLRIGPRYRTNRDGTLSDQPIRSESQSQPQTENRPLSPLPALAALPPIHPPIPPTLDPLTLERLTGDNPNVNPYLPFMISPTREPLPSGSSSDTLRNLLLAEHRRLRESREHEPVRPQWVAREYLDGLGDRQRSVSLGGEGEGDAWEPMFSTITPDIHLPSNNPNNYSLSQLNPGTELRIDNEPRIYPVRVTLPINLEADPDHLNPCDLSSSDDEDTPVNYHSIIGPFGFPIGLRSSGHNSTMSNHPPVPTIALSSTDNPTAADTHLQQMQVILDRLARREEVPDDLWAGAGLSRTMGRGLNTGANPPADNNGAALE